MSPALSRSSLKRALATAVTAALLTTGMVVGATPASADELIAPTPVVTEVAEPVEPAADGAPAETTPVAEAPAADAPVEAPVHETDGPAPSAPTAPVAQAPEVQSNAAPAVTVTPTENIDPFADNTFTVVGSNFTGAAAASGAYVVLGDSAIWSGDGPLIASGWLGLAWVMPRQIVNGAFTTTLTVPAGQFTEGVDYQVATSAAHGLSATNRSLDTFTKLQVRFPSVTVTPTTDIDPTVENVFTVTGTGFTGAAAASGAYVVLGDSAIWSGDGPLVASGWLGLAWVMPRQIVNGAFTTTLTVPAGQFTEGVDYQVATSAAHGLSATNRSLDTFTKLQISFAPEVSGPQLSVSETTNLNPSGEALTISGSGFNTTSNAPAYYGAPGLKSGFYVQIGWINDNWKPSTGGKNNFDRASAYSQWVSNMAPASLIWTDATTGAFSFDVTIDKATLDAKKIAGARLAVFTTAAGGGPAAENETSIDIAFAPEATGPRLSVSKTTDLNPAGEKLTISGSGFNTTSDAPAYYGAPGLKSGFYVQIGWITDNWKPSTGGKSGTDRSNAYSQWVSNMAPASLIWTDAATGAFTFDVTIDKATLDAKKIDGARLAVFTTAVAGGPAAQNETSQDLSWRVATPPTPPTPPIEPPVNVPAPIAAGSLSWGISSSFANYIVSPIAHGAITLSGGATKANGLYQFGQAAGGTYSAASGTGTVNYSGAVRFYGHNGILDLTFANPVIDVRGSQGTMYLTVNGSSMAFATISGLGASSTTNGLATFSGAALVLTPAAASLFAGFHFAPDPISFTIGSPGSAPAGITGTVAAAAATPSAAAIAQFVVERTVELTAESCTVQSASLDWGFKESFRNYLESIAHGEWQVGNGASYAYPNYSFTGSTGGYDAATASGGASLGGSVRFTGHEGVLDTTISNPQIELVDANSGYLLFDVVGETRDGEAITVSGIRFAELDLAAGSVESTETGITASAVPATLTTDGAAAFGTYPAGEELDDASFTLTLAPECANGVAVTSAQSSDSDDSSSEASAADVSATDAKSADLSWVAWVLGILVLLGAAIAVGVTIMKRRPARS